MSKVRTLELKIEQYMTTMPQPVVFWACDARTGEPFGLLSPEETRRALAEFDAMAAAYEEYRRPKTVAAK